MPGLTTSVAATPDAEGTYSLVCTEYCGNGHATMRAFVTVESQAEFDEWVSKQEKIPEGDEGLPLVELDPNGEAPEAGVVAPPEEEPGQPGSQAPAVGGDGG